MVQCGMIWGEGGELAPALCRVWMGGYDSICGGLSVYPWEVYRAMILPASPPCQLLVCVRILMVDPT